MSSFVSSRESVWMWLCGHAVEGRKPFEGRCCLWCLCGWITHFAGTEFAGGQPMAAKQNHPNRLQIEEGCLKRCHLACAAGVAED